MMTKPTKRCAIACFLLAIFFFQSIRNIVYAIDEKKSLPKEITLSDSTIEGSVLKPMKIPLIGLVKERKERIQRQLNQTIQIKKQFTDVEYKRETRED